MPLDTQMPAWLGERADAAWKNAATVADNFSPFLDYLNGKRAALQVENLKLGIASNALGIQQQEQSIDITKMQMQDKEQGMQEFPAWLKETGDDWQKVLDTPFTGKSQSGAEMAQKVQQQAWNKSIQQQGVDLAKQSVQNKLDEAKQKADLETQKLAIQKEHNDDWARIQDKLANVQAMKADAAKNGKSYEFEQLQNDWSAAYTQANNTDNPDQLKLLRLRIKQDEDRMQKLSKFAAEVPTEKTSTTIKSADQLTSVTKTKTGPIVAPAAPVSTNSFKVGGFTITPRQ